jgi:hypothetical protein
LVVLWFVRALWRAPWGSYGLLVRFACLGALLALLGAFGALVKQPLGAVVRAHLRLSLERLAFGGAYWGLACVGH